MLRNGCPFRAGTSPAPTMQGAAKRGWGIEMSREAVPEGGMPHPYKYKLPRAGKSRQTGARPGGGKPRP